MLQKVTAFILRPAPDGREILLFQHPYAGWQLPAGTVEPGETPEHAAVREVAEETGLANLPIKASLGFKDTLYPPDKAGLMAPTTVFSRPDPTSFDWIHIRPGMWLEVLRKVPGYTQIKYVEPDRFPNPSYDSYVIVGWVPDEVLTQTQRRHFYLFEYTGRTPHSWKVNTDNHTFTLTWHPLHDLPDLVTPQDEWMGFLEGHLKG